MEEKFKKYKRNNVAEMRPYEDGENTSLVSVSVSDLKKGSPKIGDMIARNPDNHEDQWLVAEEYFKENFELTAQPPDTVEPTAKEGEQPWELQIIKNIWRRAYLDSEEDHVKILKEYGEKIASQERSKAISECIEAVDNFIHGQVQSVKLWDAKDSLTEHLRKKLKN